MLKNYMWEIFEIAMEENGDGDNFTPDVSTAAELFVSGIMGNPTCQYEAIKRLDVPKVRAEWEALSEAEKQDDFSSPLNICVLNFAMCWSGKKSNYFDSFKLKIYFLASIKYCCSF